MTQPTLLDFVRLERPLCLANQGPISLKCRLTPPRLWSPLAGGILSGKYAKGAKTKSDTARYSGEDNPPDERKLRIGETVTQLAMK